MAVKVPLRISARAAPYARGEVPVADRLRAIQGNVPLSLTDRAALLLVFSRDRDPELKAAALTALRDLPRESVLTLAADPALHPQLIELLVQYHGDDGEFAQLLAGRSDQPGTWVPPSAAEGQTDEQDNAEAEEEYQSKYQLCQTLPVAEKIKMAMTGDKEWRGLLLKDANKLVSGAVIKNPRITDGEILAIAGSQVQNDDLIRMICTNKEWTKIYPIRKALVENPKTPLPAALRFLSTLQEKDLAGLAKSKNVATVISAQARKLIMVKEKKR